MDERKDALKTECIRQAESCLYTSTSFHLWLRSARLWRKVFVSVPIVFGGLASWSVLSDQPGQTYVWIAAVCALIAGIFPALFVALDFDTSIEEIARLAAEFKNLQDRFRKAAFVASHGEFHEFEGTVEALLDRLESARAKSLTPPERFFKAAQQKISSGDYDFGVDEMTAGQ